MRTLCKKALALCVVFALALTCFVGTLSVSAADVSFDANVSVNASPVAFGDTTATAVFHFELADKTTGINEALIKLASEIGTVAAPAELVKADGTAYSEDELSQLNYAINYVTTDGQDIADDFSNVANLGDFFLSAKNAEYFITEAFIKVTFKIGANVSAGTYAITIDAPEGKVLAASPSEDIINLKFAGANFTVTCDHANATEDVTTAPTCTEPGVKTITCACGYTTTEAIPETGHAEELTYTSNDDGTHAVDCPNCEDVFEAEECADEDANGACDKCGYVLTPEVQEPVYDASLAFKGKTALFESDYSLMYYVPVKLGTSWHIEVSREVYNKNTRLEDKKVTLTVDDVYSTTKPGDGNEYYLVALRGIATKEVANEIVAVLHNNIDGVDYYGAELSYNLVDYAVARMAKNIAKEVKYLQAFLNYAAACQVKFGYNTTDLANSVLSEEAKVVTLNGEVTQDSDVKEYEVLEGATATLNGFAPSYEDKMTLGTICKVPDNYVDAGLKIRYSYVNSAGVTKNDYVSLADSKEYSIAGYRLVMFTGLAIKEVRTPVLVTVVDANNNPISNTRQYSFEAYAAKQSETSQDYAPARAMVAFGDWFKVYKDN